MPLLLADIAAIIIIIDPVIRKLLKVEKSVDPVERVIDALIVAALIAYHFTST